MDIFMQLTEEFTNQLRARLVLKSAELKKETFTVEEIIELVEITAGWMVHNQDTHGISGDQRDWSNGLPEGIDYAGDNIKPFSGSGRIWPIPDFPFKIGGRTINPGDLGPNGEIPLSKKEFDAMADLPICKWSSIDSIFPENSFNGIRGVVPPDYPLL